MNKMFVDFAVDSTIVELHIVDSYDTGVVTIKICGSLENQSDDLIRIIKANGVKFVGIECTGVGVALYDELVYRLKSKTFSNIPVRDIVIEKFIYVRKLLGGDE